MKFGLPSALTWVTLLSLGSITVAYGQVRATASTGCPPIDSKNPYLFITYERVERENNRVWLRLHSNTNCSITVEVKDIDLESPPYRTYFTPKYLRYARPNDRNITRMRVEYVFTPPPQGTSLPLHYDYMHTAQDGAVKPGNYSRSDDQMFLVVFIAAGGSILFNVEIDHIKEGGAIFVPFNYAWETGRDYKYVYRRRRDMCCLPPNEIIHRVIFRTAELPINVLAGP